MHAMTFRASLRACAHFLATPHWHRCSVRGLGLHEHVHGRHLARVAAARVHASQRLLSCSLHRRFSTVSNVSCQPKIKESPLLITLIDIPANRTVSCGSSDEDGASIGDRFDVLGRGQGGVPVLTAVGPWWRLRGQERAQDRPQRPYGRGRGQRGGCTGAWPRV